MFLVAKLFWLLAQPLSLCFFLGLIAVLAGLFRRRGLALLSGVLALALLFVSLFTTAGLYLTEGLEARFSRPDPSPEAVSCIIVLGGGVDTVVSTDRHSYELGDDGDRYVETARLGRVYPQAPIIISGGDGSIERGYDSEADIITRLLVDFGIEPSRILNEGTSRDTYENAINTRAILGERNLSGCLLVTSGFHMPRSVAIFRHLGMDIVPWPVDFKADRGQTIGLSLRAPLINAQLLSIATREWIGMVAYYAMGRVGTIDSRADLPPAVKT